MKQRSGQAEPGKRKNEKRFTTYFHAKGNLETQSDITPGSIEPYNPNREIWVVSYLGVPAAFQSIMLMSFQGFLYSWNSTWPSLLMTSLVAG